MKIPGKATISNRTSTIASQFARARAPYITPTKDELLTRLALFDIDPEDPTCAYCGAAGSEWDHAQPMVSASAWTGYFTEISNLIPACGKCNQSRGSKPFADWMRGKAAQSPAARLQKHLRIAPHEVDAEIERRISIIERAIETSPPRRLTFEIDELETELEACRLKINALLVEAENIAAQLRRRYLEQISAI